MNAEMNVWNPHVQEQNEFSLAQFWLAAADNNGVNRDTIEGGVMVYIISSISFSFRRMQNIELLIISNFYKIICVEKQVYYEMNRDYRTRLFTFWTVRVSIFDFPASTSHVYIVSFLKSSFFFFFSFFFLNHGCRVIHIKPQAATIFCSLALFKIIFLFWKVSLYIYIYIYIYLFIYLYILSWLQNNGYQSGCYNLQCPGFVQTDNRLAFGAALEPYSDYGGDQSSVNFFVFKVVQYFNLINLSNSSNFWIHIYDHIIRYFFFLVKKFIVTNVWNSSGFSVRLNIFFLVLFFFYIHLFKF